MASGCIPLQSSGEEWVWLHFSHSCLSRDLFWPKQLSGFRSRVCVMYREGPWKGNQLSRAQCLGYSNSGKLMKLPSSKSSAGIKWDNAQKRVSPGPGASKLSVSASYRHQPRCWCHDYHLHFSDVEQAAAEVTSGDPHLLLLPPLPSRAGWT